jgi:hypothetical protein
MEVFLADRITDEANRETLAVTSTSKCQNFRMPGKRLVQHRHLNGKSMCQSGIGILASGSVWYRC